MKYIYLILCLLLTCSLEAQLNVGGQPYSFSNSLQALSTYHTLGELDQLVARQNSPDNEFAKGYKVDLTLQNAGSWNTLENGDQLWRLKIKAPNAQSIHLSYSDFWLPKGGTLYIYNEDRTQLIGGFTDKNNKGLRSETTPFTTGIITDETVILEYLEPSDQLGLGQIQIDRIYYGYRSFSAQIEKAYGDSNPCQNNINCAVGNNWQDEKRAVAMMVFNGGNSGFCTGALINDRSAELIPYFLTANHCIGGVDAIDNNADVNWLFYWNFETATCTNPATFPALSTFTSVSGARIASNFFDSDFALFRLLEDPLQTDANPVYLGWTSSSAAAASGVGIHHPSGDVKKISIENNVLTNQGTNINWDSDGDGNTDYTTPPNSHWRTIFDDGGTEGGSSGSPFLNPNGQIVGQLHGGTGDCPGDPGFDKFYGKFSWSFTGNGSIDRRRRLSDWIDQDCTNNLNIGTNYTGEEPVIIANAIDAFNTVGPSAFVRYEGGDYVDLEVGFDAVAGSDFMASIGNGCGSNFKYKNQKSNPTRDNISVDKYGGIYKNSNHIPEIERRSELSANELLVKVSPNPAVDLAYIEWQNLLQPINKIEIYNSLGVLVRAIIPKQDSQYNREMKIDLNGVSGGIYQIVLYIENRMLTQSLIVTRI